LDIVQKYYFLQIKSCKKIIAMQITYPYTIDNGHGEKLTFVKIVNEGNKEYVEVENYINPGGGPPMHVHHRQTEALTVVQGRLATQIAGQETKFHEAGATATFLAGVPHKFWNAGTEPLICKGYVTPADNIVYFLSEIYRSARESKTGRPGTFDSAYLLSRYKTEFDIVEIPAFVRKVIFPISLFLGKLSGKHKKFAGAPEPVR
jgi:quercetin dioxygenase-like cupin family protein